MQPYPSEDEPYNLANELAKERTRNAADRTLMAWIRTSLSLIGFGFGIPEIVRTISTLQDTKGEDRHLLAITVGLSFIGIGIFSMTSSLRAYHRQIKRLQSRHFTYESSHFAELVGLSLLLVGIVSFLGILLRLFAP